MLSDITQRERDCLLLMAEGFGNKEIARKLGVSHRTVDIHTASIKKKLGARCRTHMAVLAIRRGLIQ